MPGKTALPPWVFNLHREDLGVPRQLAEGIRARVFSGEHAQLSIVRIEPNRTGKVHSHPEEQWGILLEGECTRIQGDQTFEMKAGDFWRTPGGTPHGIRTGALPALVLDVFSPPRREYRWPGQGFGAAAGEGEGRR